MSSPLSWRIVVIFTSCVLFACKGLSGGSREAVMAAMAEIFSPQLSADTGYDHRGYPAQYPPAEAYEVSRGLQSIGCMRSSHAQ